MKTLLLQKFSILSISTVLLCATLSSCDGDGGSSYSPKPAYYTTNGTLDYTTSYDNYPPQTNDEGYEEFNVRFDIEDINGFKKYDELYKIEVTKSYFEINLVEGRFENGDNIYIELSDYDNEEKTIYIKYTIKGNNFTGVSINENDDNYYNFVQYLFNQLKRYGYVKLNIYAEMNNNYNNPIRYEKFDVIFENNLKLYYKN